MADKNQEQPKQPVVNVDELLPQLSNKNSDYVFKLRKFVKEQGVSDEKEEAILQDLLPKILVDQRAGKPASSVYGAPSVLASNLLQAPKQTAAKQPFWLETIDLGLSFLTMFSVIYGAMAFFAKNASQDASGGFLSLLMMSFFAAFVFTYYNRWMEMDKAKRPNLFLILLAGVSMIILVSVASTWLTMNVDTFLTRQLPPVAQFVVAALAYGTHYYLKKKYHLRSLFMATPRKTTK